MQNGGFQNNPLMRLTLLFSCLFLMGLWATNFLLYFSKIGLTSDCVVRYYLGSEQNFTMPRSYQSMLEVTHMHLTVMGLVILMLTHLLIFAPFQQGTKVAFIVVAFVSAFMNEASGWLVRFVHPGFGWLKVVSFIIFQSTLTFLLIALAWFLIAGKTTTGASTAKRYTRL